MLAPVSAWAGDRLTTSAWNQAPSLLSLSLPSVAGWNEYLAKAGGVNRHVAWYTSPYPWSCSVCLGLAYRDQCRLAGICSALEVITRNALYKSMSTLLYFTLDKCSHNITRLQQLRQTHTDLWVWPRWCWFGSAFLFPVLFCMSLAAWRATRVLSMCFF